MALDLSKTFCTAITEPERYAAYDFTSASVPTETQVEEYCYDIASIIVFQTERAGQRYAPPVSGVSDTHLARLLTQCNAIGAAYLARQHVYTFNGDQQSLMVMQRLAGLWQMYMGEGSLNVTAGMAALQLGSGGAIGDAVASLASSRVLRSDVTEGDVTLGAIDSIEITPEFKASTVD